MEITKEEQLDYLESSSRLMLWFAREWLKSHPQETFEKVIRKRIDLWRRTDFNTGRLDGPFLGYSDAWLDLVGDLSKILQETADAPDSGAFEERCCERLRPHWEGRLERDVLEQRNDTQISGYQCGSLRYNLEPDKKHPERIGIHIANACYPGSPFDDPLYFPSCLLVLTAQCTAKFGVTEIGTGTWLNSHQKWLELFPEEWKERLSPPNEDIHWDYGFWGQFLTARRTFNHKLGAKFRATGKMPFAQRYSWCSIQSLRKHLLQKAFGKMRD
jgi:hypothetical protein